MDGRSFHGGVMTVKRSGARKRALLHAAHPACFFTSLLVLAMSKALVTSPFYLSGSSPRRSCIRSRNGRIHASSAKNSGEIPESADLYASLRERLKELELARTEKEEDSASRLRSNDMLEGNLLPSPTRDGPVGNSAPKAYSGSEMKRAYYEAFWRARNLNKSGHGAWSRMDEDRQVPEGFLPPDLAGRPSVLSPMAMEMMYPQLSANEASAEPTSAEVQGLTQMYFLNEHEEPQAEMVAAGADRDAAGCTTDSRVEKGTRGLSSSGGDKQSWPQGLTQIFCFDDVEETAAEAASAKDVICPSFLSETLGVPTEVVQNLRQVELDHARLAMLAVLLSGVVGAGAGVPASANALLDTQHGLQALADVARAPWLDPCVAGVILTAKAVSEGDWRIGKGVLARWADQALRAASESGAKVLRLGSGDEIRRLAVEMEVKHGRVALGAVLCAMAQQGVLPVGA